MPETPHLIIDLARVRENFSVVAGPTCDGDRVEIDSAGANPAPPAEHFLEASDAVLAG